MLKERLKVAAVTSLVWISCLSSCAGEQVTAWFLDSKTSNELIRKDDAGHVIGQKPYVDAYGYICYSPADDEAWRVRMGTLDECCSSKGGR